MDGKRPGAQKAHKTAKKPSKHNGSEWVRLPYGVLLLANNQCFGDVCRPKRWFFCAPIALNGCGKSKECPHGDLALRVFLRLRVRFCPVGDVFQWLAFGPYSERVRPRCGRRDVSPFGSGGVRYAQTTGYLLGPRCGPSAAGPLVWLMECWWGCARCDDPEGMQEGSRRLSRSGAPPECRPKRVVIPEGSQIEVRPRRGR